ncbi:MAG: hypothetical protein IH886_04585 [Nitrospinae bacterium]|nr:hypothetical protein [Nitrospinota bacterium]
MDIGKLTITKMDLERIPDKDRVFFLQMLNLITEINIFQKLLLYSMQYPKNNIQKTAKAQISLNLLFVLAGKLFEGWKLIDERKPKEKNPKKGERKKGFLENWFPKKYKSLLSHDGNKYLNQLEQYFANPNNNIKKIRNKISHHFDSEIIRKHFPSTTMKEISLYLPKYVGEIFSTSNYITLDAFFTQIDPNQAKAFRIVIGEVLSVSKNFGELIGDYVGIIHEKYLKKAKFETLSIPDPKSTDKIHLTFFSKPSIKKSKK